MSFAGLPEGSRESPSGAGKSLLALLSWCLSALWGWGLLASISPPLPDTGPSPSHHCGHWHPLPTEPGCAEPPTSMAWPFPELHSHSGAQLGVGVPKIALPSRCLHSQLGQLLPDFLGHSPPWPGPTETPSIICKQYSPTSPSQISSRTGPSLMAPAFPIVVTCMTGLR